MTLLISYYNLLLLAETINLKNNVLKEIHICVKKEYLEAINL